MEEYTVALTPQAEQQLRAIVHHIAHELLEPETADALLTALEQAMASLSLLPQRAPLVEEEPWHSQNKFVVKTQEYFVYFKVFAADLWDKRAVKARRHNCTVLP